jgi:hypothetical protein
MKPDTRQRFTRSFSAALLGPKMSFPLLSIIIVSVHNFVKRWLTWGNHIQYQIAAFYAAISARKILDTVTHDSILLVGLLHRALGIPLWVSDDRCGLISVCL